MKTKYIILSIIGLTLVAMWMIGVPYMGANPMALLAIPLAISQLIFSEGHAAVCFEYCGPCSSWGEDYLLFEDGCRLPTSVEDCNSIYPKAEWKFMDDKCIPLNPNPTIITLD